MNLRHAYRPWLAIVLLIMVASLSTGCSKSPAKPVPVLPIPQADADDIAQLVATTLSADNGGWYCLIKSYAESLSVPAPAPALTSTGTEVCSRTLLVVESSTIRVNEFLRAVLIMMR